MTTARTKCPGRLRPWSIARFAGPSPFELQPDVEVHNPVLTASDVDVITASYRCIHHPDARFERSGRWFTCVDAQED
jgi:hypothetical protein